MAVLKWTSDSRTVVTYCMSAQDTLTYRFGSEDGDSQLLRIAIATGITSVIEAGPGVKLLPAMLPSGEIAYLRRDKTTAGVFYGSGRPGPKGQDLRTPCWSPDGTQLVYSRFISKHPPEPHREWSRNQNFEMYSTAWLPAYDSSGEHLGAPTHGRRRRDNEPVCRG